MWVELTKPNGDLVRGGQYGAGLGDVTPIDAVKFLVQRTDLGGAAVVNSQIFVEKSGVTNVSYTLKAANLAAQIAAPLMKTAAQVLAFTGAMDETGQPKTNGKVFLPFNEFTIINDKAMIALDIVTGGSPSTQKLVLPITAIATGGSVAGLHDFKTVAVFGTAGDDIGLSVPNPFANPSEQKAYVFGGFGNDTIRTGGGNDLIFGDNNEISPIASHGQDGSDTIFAGARRRHDLWRRQKGHHLGEGRPRHHLRPGRQRRGQGGDGNDDIYRRPRQRRPRRRHGIDRIWGGVGKDYIDGGDDDDILVAGSDGPETDTSENELYGGAGNDKLFGDKGNDYLDGEDGRDALDGNDGADEFFGGRDADSYRGGAGADEFYVGPQDRVLDSAADDKLFLQYVEVTSTHYLSEFREFGAYADDGLRHGYNYYAIADADSTNPTSSSIPAARCSSSSGTATSRRCRTTTQATSAFRCRPG